MIATLVNTGAIIVGTLIGCLLKQGLNEKQSKILMQAMGLVALVIGINSVVQNMENSTSPVLFIASLAIGACAGQAIDLDGRINSLSTKCKNIGNIEGLVTATLLFCVGALSILGPIESAIHDNQTLLYTNALLDFVTSMVLASTFGISIIYSAAILLCWQGSIYLGATYLEPFISDSLMCEIGIVGGVLIFATGLSILKIVEVKTVNFLPALLVPIIYFIIHSLI